MNEQWSYVQTYIIIFLDKLEGLAIHPTGAISWQQLPANGEEH